MSHSGQINPNKQISRSDIVQLRRRALIARIQLQRQQLIWQSAALHHELRFIELGLRAARALRASPLLIAAVAAGLTILKPRRILYLVKTGLSSWRIWRKFEPVFMPLIGSISNHSLTAAKGIKPVPKSKS